jgi:uroporphyrinogen decarboxylase
MTPKQRVHAGLKKQPVDRVPIFMWFHPETAAILSKLLEIPAGYVGIAMGNDIDQTWVNNNYAMEGIVHDREGEFHTDFWGLRWMRKGAFNQIISSPLESAKEEEIVNYVFPEDRIDELLNLMIPVVSNGRDAFIGCDVSPCVFEMYTRIRGMEKAILDLVLHPDLSDTMLSRCADFAIQLSEAVCGRFHLDWLWTGDDVGFQESMLMSPSVWRDMIKPHLQRVISVGKSWNLPVAYHSCGSIRPIIEDLIEIGVDVLNPIQCNCPGMNPLELKREYGSRISFMGGVDTQGILPHGSADDVRRATNELVEGMTFDGGGFILAASHTVPPETPSENIFAMYEAAGLGREEIFDNAASLRASLGSG